MAVKKEIRDRRYNAVYNAWADTKIASRARFWSEKKIYNELGVIVPKRIPKRKTISKTRKKTLSNQLEKFRVLILTEDPREAYLKSRGVKPKVKKSKKKTSKDQELRKKRIAQWKVWSENKSFPEDIKREARDINRRSLKSYVSKNKLSKYESLDLYKNHSFGWAVMYNAYIWGENSKEWEEMLKQVDVFNEIYTFTRKRSKSRK